MERPLSPVMARLRQAVELGPERLLPGTGRIELGWEGYGNAKFGWPSVLRHGEIPIQAIADRRIVPDSQSRQVAHGGGSLPLRLARIACHLARNIGGPSLLELCRELPYRMLSHCNFCPWNCWVDRKAATKFGACKLASASRVSSHFHHTGEELFYRGTEGLGTIFSTSCNMRCAFCQNGDISTDKDNGEETDPRTLAAMACTLRPEGCHNISWVGGEVVSRTICGAPTSRMKI